MYKIKYLLKQVSKIPVDIWALSLNILAMCNELDRIAFYIWRIIDSHLSPTSSLIFFLNLFRTAPKDIHDDVILIDLILRISVRQP